MVHQRHLHPRLLRGGVVVNHDGLGPALRRIFSRGWKSYVARRGYREGAYGLALALFSALYPMLIYLKVTTRRDATEREKTTP